MLRGLAITIILAGASPALAQPCKITRTENGLRSAVSAEISGTAAKRIVVETGPVLARLQLEAGAKDAGYSIKAGEHVAFYTFRNGESVAGKDWMLAGAVATSEAGFAVEWPHLLLKGKPVSKLAFEFTMEDNSSGSWTTNQSDKTGRHGVIFANMSGVGTPHGFADLTYGEDEFDAESIWADWEADILARKPLQVTFVDKSNGLELATATFTYPSTEATMARYVQDVTVFRKAFTEKRCEPIS